MISGPSGVGKGTLVGKILDRVPNIFLSISATTRPPRAGEIEGVDYYFLSREDFCRDIENDCFLEWANIYGDLYGTPKAPIDLALAAGRLVILEIDVQGALQVQDKLGHEAGYVFIMPPSAEELAKRLSGRKTETSQARRTRLETAGKEIALADRYDYVVLNDNLEQAVEDLVDVLLNKILKED
ncbi:MAG: guanylate kinase [Actinomycetota bacterium]|nr:guanylate kinase [Actinomycetota bacterium]